MKTSLLALVAMLALSLNSFAVLYSGNKNSSAVGNSDSNNAVTVTAVDMVTKVYGVFDPSLTRKQTRKAVKKNLKINPSVEKNALWLESEDGYVVNYSGMTPDVSAVAQYDENDSIVGFCYFFKFPYTSTTRCEVNREQCAFSSSLLQELNDFAMMLGVPDVTESLFQAIGTYGSNHINVVLTDERDLNESSTIGNLPDIDGAALAGTYILTLDITPKAFSHFDDIMAENLLPVDKAFEDIVPQSFFPSITI